MESEYAIQEKIRFLRTATIIAVILAVAISILIIVLMDPFPGIIILTILWACVGVILAFLAGKINSMKANRVVPANIPNAYFVAQPVPLMYNDQKV